MTDVAQQLAAMTTERDNLQARLEKAAKVFREQRDHLAHLEKREKEGAEYVAALTRKANDLTDTLKDQAVLLLIEMQDGVRDVTVYTGDGAPEAAQKAHRSSSAKVAFLCTVVAGPVGSIQLLTNAWTSAIVRGP